jgi:hypothetical protein
VSVRPRKTWNADVPRWEADPRAIEAAMRVLGLKRPVHVKPTRMWQSAGLYGGFDKGYHVIYVAYNLRSDAASRVIWHELTHALQRERHPSWASYEAEYAKQMAAVDVKWPADRKTPLPRRYMTAPMERECTASEKLHNILPLTSAGQPKKVWVRHRHKRMLVI